MADGGSKCSEETDSSWEILDKSEQTEGSKLDDAAEQELCDSLTNVLQLSGKNADKITDEAGKTQETLQQQVNISARDDSQSGEPSSSKLNVSKSDTTGETDIKTYHHTKSDSSGAGSSGCSSESDALSGVKSRISTPGSCDHPMTSAGGSNKGIKDNIASGDFHMQNISDKTTNSPAPYQGSAAHLQLGREIIIPKTENKVSDTQEANQQRTEKTEQVGLAQTEQVGPAQAKQVGPAQTEQVGPAQIEQVGPAQTEQFGPAQTEQFGPAQREQVGPAQREQVGLAQAVKYTPGSCAIEENQQIPYKVKAESSLESSAVTSYRFASESTSHANSDTNVKVAANSCVTVDSEANANCQENDRQSSDTTGHEGVLKSKEGQGTCVQDTTQLDIDPEKDISKTFTTDIERGTSALPQTVAAVAPDHNVVHSDVPQGDTDCCYMNTEEGPQMGSALDCTSKCTSSSRQNKLERGTPCGNINKSLPQGGEVKRAQFEQSVETFSDMSTSSDTDRSKEDKTSGTQCKLVTQAHYGRPHLQNRAAQQTLAQGSQSSRRKVDKVCCRNSEMLEALGFKEYCESSCTGLYLEFDHTAQELVLTSSFNFTECVEKKMLDFQKKISCTGPFSQDIVCELLMKKEASRKFICSELRQLGKNIYLEVHQKDGLIVHCMCDGKDIETVIRQFVCVESFFFRNKEMVAHAMKIINSDFSTLACSELGRVTDPVVFQLLVAATSDVADHLFKKLRLCLDEENGDNVMSFTRGDKGSPGSTFETESGSTPHGTCSLPLNMMPQGAHQLQSGNVPHPSDVTREHRGYQLQREDGPERQVTTRVPRQRGRRETNMPETGQRAVPGTASRIDSCGHSDRSRTDGLERVETHEFISDIFAKNESLQAQFMLNLSRKKVFIDGKELSKGIVAIAHAGRKEVVSAALEENFFIQQFPQELSNKLDTQLIEWGDSLKARHQGYFNFGLSKKNNHFSVVCHIRILPEIAPFIASVQTKIISVPVPGYLWSHLSGMVKDWTKTLKVKSFHPKQIQIQTDKKNDQPFIEIKADRMIADKVEQEIFRLLGKLLYREKVVDSHLGSFLLDKRGQGLLANLSEDCTIQIQTPEHKVLLHAWSAQGCQLMAIEGNMVKSDAGVMVLPFCDGQGSWPKTHQQILDRAYLSSSVGNIAKAVGSDPGKKNVLELQGNGNMIDKTVMLMAVPSPTDKLFEQGVRQSVHDVLNATTPDSTLALSLSLGETTKAVLHAVVEKLTDRKSPEFLLKLYFDRNASSNLRNVCEELDDHLTKRGWATRGCFKHQSAIGRHTVRVEVAEILDVEADVLVNTTDPDLKHKDGLVSRTLLEKAGKILSNQCKEQYVDGLGDHNIAVTNGCCVKKFKEIFHIVLYQKKWHELKGDRNMENALLERMKACVLSCLTLASAKQFQSIVFPSLGTGMLGYPHDRVAKTMFQATRDFFKEMPHSSLQDVIFCCYKKNMDVLKAFKAAECAQQFDEAASWRKEHETEAFFTVTSGKDKVSSIWIPTGDPAALPFVPEILICSNARSKDKLEAYRSHKNFRMVYGQNIGKEMKHILEKAAQYSNVQVNLDTFDTKHFQELVTVVSKEIRKKMLHILLSVPEEKEFDDLMQLVPKEWREISLSLKGDETKDEDKLHQQRACTAATSCVQICGQKKCVEAVLEKIVQEGSPVDPEPDCKFPEDSGDTFYRGVQDNQPPAGYTFSIPVDFLERELLESFLKKSELSEKCQFREGSITFQLGTKEEWEAAFLSVLKFINRDQHDRKILSPIQHHLPKAQEDGPSQGSLTKELDAVTVEALRTLMKEDFMKMKVDQTGRDTVTIQCHGSTAQDTMNRIDSLRQEEVQLGQDDLQKIPVPLDTTEEGVDAYLVPVPRQGKVIIFSFDYNAVSRAKHLLNVKLGKVKVTARARRRFEGKSDTSGDGPSSQSPPLGRTSPAAGAAEFTTKCGIKVSVYKTDITKLPVGAIVNAANERLAHGGGVAYAIAKAAGFDLEDEGEDYIKRNGPLRVREVLATTAGSLPCKKVLHAVGPRWSDYKDKSLCQQHLVDTVYNCLSKADSMQLTSLAIPSISAAIFGVPKEVCAVSYLSAVQTFEKKCGHYTSVRHVHFVDVNDDMINAIQETFIQHWNTDISSKRPEVRIVSAPAPAQQDLMSSNTGSRSTEQAGSQLPQRYGDGLSSDGKNSAPLGEKTQNTWLEVHRNDKGETIEFHYHLQDLVLLFKCQSVTEPWTDVLVLWQETGNIARDENFRQYKELLRPAAQAILSTATPSMTSAGRVLHVELNASSVLFPVVSSHSAMDADIVQQMVEQCLDKVDSFHKASVAIPTHPRTIKDSKESNLAVTNFAVGIFKAVKNFSKRHKSVKQIHVISPDLETIKCITDTVSQQIVMEKSLLDTPPSVSGSGQPEPVTDDCVICHDTIENPKTLKCGHTFCTKCVDKWLYEKPCCPNCKKSHGTLIGNQPRDGRMEMKPSSLDVSGHKGYGSFVIDYYFTGGVQTDKHPQPGKSYDSTSRTAYLPNTQKGRTVLMLLKTAFDRRLIFTVGQSSTTGWFGIIWNDIHHKTYRSGGAAKHGYPDPTYLTRVTAELADQGVTEEDLSDIQKDFIEKPEKYIGRTFSDFSHHFKLPSITSTFV